MSSGRGNDIDLDTAIHRADRSAKVDPEKDLKDNESKADWLKRRNKEDRKQKQQNVVLDEWFEVVAGKKLVKKMKKKSGGVYSSYICNIKKKKNQDVMKGLEKQPNGTYLMKVSPK